MSLSANDLRLLTQRSTHPDPAFVASLIRDLPDVESVLHLDRPARDAVYDETMATLIDHGFGRIELEPDDLAVVTARCWAALSAEAILGG